jgi:hypothetical protein
MATSFSRRTETIVVIGAPVACLNLYFGFMEALGGISRAGEVAEQSSAFFRDLPHQRLDIDSNQFVDRRVHLAA